VPRDLEEELAVLSCVQQLPFGRSANWQTRGHEGPGVEGQILSLLLALLSDKLDSFEL
jgi:hypothetical protein